MNNKIFSIFILFLLAISHLAFCETIVERVYVNGDSTSIYDIELDNSGDVYITQNPQGILKYENGQWIQVGTESSIDISIAPDNSLWSRKKNLFLKYKDGVWTNYEYDHSKYPISYIAAAGDDVVWGLTDTIGVCRFDFKNEKITIYDESDGVAYPYGRLIYATSDGHIWVSHTNINFCEHCVYKGVSHFDGENWENFTVENGLPGKEVRSIVAYSAHEVYIGGYDGIVKYNGETLEPFADYRADTMGKGYDGALWVATWENYSSSERSRIYLKYKNGSIEKYERYNKDFLSKIVFDKDDTVWTLFGSILYKEVISKQTFIDTSQKILPISLATSPNPFNPVTTISFTLPMDSIVQIEVYNLNGQKIDTLIDEKLSAGKHTVNWNGSHYASGLYFCRLRAGNMITTSKMCLVK